MYKDGFGAVYAASDFGDGVPIPDLTVYEDIFPIRYGFNVGPNEKLGWSASGNSGGLQSRKEGLVWNLSANTSNQLIQSPDNLGVDIVDRIPQLFIFRIAKVNPFESDPQEDYILKIFDENNVVTNIPFIVDQFSDLGGGEDDVKQIHVPIPTLSGTQIRRIKIVTSTNEPNTTNRMLIEQIIIG